jgi:hypothetical protein
MNLLLKVRGMVFVAEGVLTMKGYMVQKRLRPLPVENWYQPLMRSSDIVPCECICHDRGAGVVIRDSVWRHVNSCKNLSDGYMNRARQP